MWSIQNKIRTEVSEVSNQTLICLLNSEIMRWLSFPKCVSLSIYPSLTHLGIVSWTNLVLNYFSLNCFFFKKSSSTGMPTICFMSNKILLYQLFSTRRQQILRYLLNTVTTETVFCCHLFVMEEQLWKLWTFSMTLMERVPLVSSIPFFQ